MRPFLMTINQLQTTLDELKTKNNKSKKMKIDSLTQTTTKTKAYALAVGSKVIGAMLDTKTPLQPKQLYDARNEFGVISYNNDDSREFVVIRPKYVSRIGYTYTDAIYKIKVNQHL